MQGASRESLARAGEHLDQLAGSEDPRGFLRVADGLFSVAALLEREGRLRRALADPSLPGPTKVELVRALLADQLDQATLGVLDEIVRARWSRPTDLLDALDTLGATAALIAAEAGGELDDVEDQLFRFSRILDREPALLMTLTDQALPLERKRQLVRALLEDRAHQVTLRLVEEIVAHPRGRTLDRALEDYAALAARRRQRLVAVVRVAVPLSQDEEARLAAALARQFGSQMQLQVEVEPEVIGGVHVRVADFALDGTVARRLAEVRRRLVR